MGQERVLLSEEVLTKQGAFERVRRYWRGGYPELENSVLVFGWQGKETKQEVSVVRPKEVFNMRKND
jgi:hypothetical protein